MSLVGQRYTCAAQAEQHAVLHALPAAMSAQDAGQPVPAEKSQPPCLQKAAIKAAKPAAAPATLDTRPKVVVKARPKQPQNGHAALGSVQLEPAVASPAPSANTEQSGGGLVGIAGYGSSGSDASP